MSLWKKPLWAFLTPWVVLVVATVGFHNVVPLFHHAYRAALTIGYEVIRQHDEAAASILKLSTEPDRRLDFWRRDVFRNAGMSAMLSGRFPVAIEHFSRIVTHVDPFNNEIRYDYFALINRGICLHKEALTDRARTDWALAMASYPGRHDAWLIRGHSYLLEGDRANARADYQRVLEISGQLGVVYADMGDAWRYVGEIAEAERIYLDGLNVDPGDVFCRLRLAELALIEHDDAARALREIAIIRRIMPTLRVVDALETAIHRQSPIDTLQHIPAARFEAGHSHQWTISPTKVYFEFFREDWHGW